MSKTLIFAACVGLAGQSYAAQYLVPTDYPTVQAALDAESAPAQKIIQAGDEIRVENGHVDPGFTLVQAYAGNIRIFAAPGDAATVEGPVVVNSYNGLDNGSKTTIAGLTISNTNLTDGILDSVFSGVHIINTSNNIVIDDCTITGNQSHGVNISEQSGLGTTIYPTYFGEGYYPAGTYNTTITIQNSTISGNGIEPVNGGHGVNVVTLSGVSIFDTNIENNALKGVHAENLSIVNITGTRTNDVSTTNISNNGDQGVYMFNRSTGQIQGARLDNNGSTAEAAIHIYRHRPFGEQYSCAEAGVPGGDSADVARVIIDDNRILASTTGVKLEERAEAISISNNKITGCSNGVVVSKRSNVETMDSNTITGFGGNRGVSFHLQSFGHMQNNTISGYISTGAVGVEATVSSWTELDPYGYGGAFGSPPCDWPAAWEIPIAPLTMFNNTITNNKINVLAEKQSQVIFQPQAGAGTENQITNALSHGIYAFERSHITIGEGTLIDGNGGDGIHLYRLTTGTITNASITNNGGNGITAKMLEFPPWEPGAPDFALPLEINDSTVSDNGAWGVQVGSILYLSTDPTAELEGRGRANITNSTIEDNTLGGVVSDRSSKTNILNSQINNAGLSETADVGILFDRKSTGNIQGNTVANFGAEGIIVRRLFPGPTYTDPDPSYIPLLTTIVGNDVNNNGSDGITLGYLYDPTGEHLEWGRADAKLINNIIASNGGNGVNVQYSSPPNPSLNADPANPIEIVNCTIVDNGLHGIRTTKKSSTLALNTIVAFNSGHGSYTSYASWHTIDTGVIFGNQSPFKHEYTGNTVDNGHAEVNPDLNGSWHLNTGSTCIDAGTGTPGTGDVPTTDIDGDTRDSLVDVGADEVIQADSDSDGITDLYDNCPAASNPLQEDGDFDGIGDACDNCPNTAGLDQTDTDGDGVGDICEMCPGGDDKVDTDGDTMPDACDVCAGGNDLVDTDGDLVPNDCDNCTEVSNANQRDTNGDGFGNMCDADLNNNGSVNIADLGAFKAVYGTSNPDADFNGNGSVNLQDLGIFKSLYGKAPGPKGILVPYVP